MIQASRSPSSSRRLGVLQFGGGPLDLTVHCRPGPTLDLLASTLSLYDVPWTLTPHKPVQLKVEVASEAVAEAARGDYLECAQMLVDHAPGGLRATTSRGALLVGRFVADGEAWHMTVPARVPVEGWWPEIEDLVSLIVTTGWRRSGWVPLHAAGLTRDGVGVLVCAASRGGKTTFSLALARRGWRVVGDDKLLLGTVDGTTTVAAVKHMLNVDPALRDWFPELGDINHLPIYSEWSPKRRVPLAHIFPDAPAASMGVSHVVSLVRRDDAHGLAIEEMDVAQTLSTLLHQTVMPNDARVAREITARLVAVGQSAHGLRVTVPAGIYRDRDALQPLEAALR